MQTGSVPSGPGLEPALAAYLDEMQQALCLDAGCEAEILREIRFNILECAEGYRLETPELSQEEALALALADFGPAAELGRTFHATYRRPLSLKEVALLAAFPFALVPLLGIDWTEFARAPEPAGWLAFGTSVILLALGSLFSRRLRTPVFYVWITVLMALLGSMSFAVFRLWFEPRELLALTTTSGVPQRKISIPAEQVDGYIGLVRWWDLLRFGFSLALILFLVYWVLRLARREWTLASLAILTFVVIGPYQLLDTRVVIQAGKDGADGTASFSLVGRSLDLLNPIQLNSAGTLLQVFLTGGLLFSALSAAYLSLPLNPARYVPPGESKGWGRKLKARVLGYCYARPRIVRSCLVLAGLIFSLGYYQSVRLVYEHWYWRPSFLLAFTLVLGAIIFFPRSVVVLWSKRKS